MKVVCAGCQAKYQIPDERVAGRKLKIRCRKCGEAIIVRGDQAAQPASAQMGYPPPPSADEWHVSLEGDQHGPYPSAQMATMLRNGQLAWDAYVWRDGYSDWKTAGDSDTLVRAVAAGAELSQDDDPTNARLAPEALQPLARSAFAARAAQRSSPPFAEATPPAYEYAGEAAGYQDSYADQGGHAEGGYAQGNYEENAYAQGGYAEGGYAQAGYAQADYQEGGYAVEGGYAEGGYAESPQFTGQREEDSLLFSARNLQLAASAPIAQPQRAGHAGGEGSGLIDIRALASLARTSQAGSAPVKTNGHSNGRGREEVRAALAHQTGAFGRIDSLAPVDRPSRSSSNAVPLAIVTGSAMVAAAAFLGVYLTRDQGAPASAPVAVSNVQPVAAEPVAAEPAAEEPGAEPTAAEPAEPAAAEESERRATADKPEKSATSSRSSSKSRSSSRRSERSERTLRAAKAEPKAKPEKPEKAEKSGSDSASAKKGASPSIDDLLLADAKPEPKPEKATAPEAAAPSAQPAKSSAKRSIDDLLDGAVEHPDGPKKPQAAAAASSSALPDSPSRAQVSTAMKGVASEVKACAEGQTLESPTATVAVTVAGATGNVSGVRVTGIQGSVGSCIARAVRGANFPKFAKEQLTINYPFKLK